MKKTLKWRHERDSLGDMKIPLHALYGAQTARALENFPISGRTAHPSLIRAYLRIKLAAAASNQSCGALDSGRAHLITHAVKYLLTMNETQWSAHFPVDPYQAGAGTSQNMNVNEVIANRANQLKKRPLGTYAPVHPNDHVNLSQSTNDTFPTAMKLALLEDSRTLQQELKKLSQVFKLQGSKWRFIPKAARTHLQDAVPMTLGQEFSAYGETLKKCADWTAEAREKLRELGIGGSAAGTGLTVPAHFSEMIREHLEKLSGEKLWISKNLFESMQSQASIVYYSSMLRLTALELTRICNDLRLLASGPLNGLHEIDLPAAQPGSSMMPGKVNPSLLEMANQTWFAILGYDHTIACAAQAGQLELNVMMPIIAHSALEATRFSARAIASLRLRCIQGIQPNFARLRRNFENTPQTATVLTRLLGYETTAHLVQEALLLGVSVIELVRKKNLIPESTLKTLLNTRTLTGL